MDQIEGKGIAANPAVSLTLDNFSISTKGNGKTNNKKFIVHPLKITIPDAKLFGIMGGSGSGKTTLLNVLAGRYTGSAYDMDLSKIYFSKEKCSVGYVTQQDFLLPHLTVYETLLFTAKLKIPIDKLPDLLSHRQGLDMEDIENIENMKGYDHMVTLETIHEKSAVEITQLYDRLVLDVINDLGLSDRVHARIGDGGGATGKRGLSGGEKRRVSVGLQVLTDPEVLCADEPTSGLDSFTAVVVMEKLKKLTTRKKRQITVICSIHQPRSDVFDLFDHVLILTKGGEAVFCGAVSNMVSYFSNKGFPCPEDANPADYYIDQSSIDKDNPDSVKRVRLLIDEYNKDKDILQQEVQRGLFVGTSTVLNKSPVEPSELSHISLASLNGNINALGGISWFQQFLLLLKRFFVNNLRDTSHMSGGLIQAICLGFMVMGIFWNLGESVTDIESRSGLLYINVSMEQYILMIILVERYCRDLKIFDRELQDNLYHPTAYYLAHIVTSIPNLMMQSIIYSIPIYFGCNLRPGWSHVLMFFAVNITLGLVLNGLVWMCLSASRIFSVASLIANMNFTFISLTAGFLVNYNTMPVYIGWVRNISCLSYAYRILMNNEFADRTIGDCPAGFESSCDGNDILRSYGVKPNYVLVPWIILIVIALVYYSVAAITLTYLRFPPNGAVVVDPNAQDEDIFTIQDDSNSNSVSIGAPAQIAVTSEETHEVEVEDEECGGLPPIPPSPNRDSHTNSPMNGLKSTKEYGIDIYVASVTLTAQTSSTSIFGNPERKQILKDIDLRIQPSRLVAIMGGSGSGKTTLLNLIANRIPQSAIQPVGYRTVPEESAAREISFGGLKKVIPFFHGGSEYSGEGSICFGGSPQSPLFIRKNMGYVEQFDHHLPTLTVEETIHINAKLRMPLTSSTQDIQDRVNNILQRLALTHCRNVRVGNEAMKGISGGEKRRLSIGIQLLTDPAILLLDEPTTGLDAFTARHVVETLKKEVKTRRISPPFLRTLILTIHQPRYDIFREIDDVILLSKAELVYCGPAKDVKSFFERVLEVECPHMHNPADFILDYSSIDVSSRKDFCQFSLGEN
jgi:ABC-type multidrug transport system ATPase subunit